MNAYAWFICIPASNSLHNGMAVYWSYPCRHLLIFMNVISLPIFLRLFLFFLHLFYVFMFWACVLVLLNMSYWLMSACADSRGLIVESFGFPSDNLISLSYLLPVFSTNSFWLFLKKILFTLQTPSRPLCMKILRIEKC